MGYDILCNLMKCYAADKIMTWMSNYTPLVYGMQLLIHTIIYVNLCK